jgi:hypothetical protein
MVNVWVDKLFLSNVKLFGKVLRFMCDSLYHATISEQT